MGGEGSPQNGSAEWQGIFTHRGKMWPVVVTSLGPCCQDRHPRGLTDRVEGLRPSQLGTWSPTPGLAKLGRASFSPAEYAAGLSVPSVASAYAVGHLGGEERGPGSEAGSGGSGRFHHGQQGMGGWHLLLAEPITSRE